MPGQDDRQRAGAIFDHFHEACEVREGVPREGVRFVHKEDHRALAFFDQCTQVPLAFLALGWDA